MEFSMNLLERVLTLLRANLTTVVEQADNPEKVLRQLQLDMRNQLVQVKTQVATAIAESHKLKKRSAEKKAEADAWLKKAEQALQQELEDAARAALLRYNDFHKQAQRYQQQQQEQEQLVKTMRGALRQLEAKISEVETSIDLLVTRKRNALIQQRVLDALNKTGEAQHTAQTTKAQEAVREAEARARALSELHKQHPQTQLSPEQELEHLSEEQELEQQLRTLKARKHSPQESQTQETQSPISPARGDLSSKRREDKLRDKETNSLADIDIEYLKKMLDSPQNS